MALLNERMLFLIHIKQLTFSRRSKYEKKKKLEISKAEETLADNYCSG